MNKEAYLPPSTQDLKLLPDYYLGCLIYWDEQGDDTMRWICYDGRTKYRCATRAAAENCARQIRLTSTDEQCGHLMSAHHFLTRAWRALDKAAAASDVETRLWLELKSVEARKLADAVDTLLSQKMPSKSKI